MSSNTTDRNSSRHPTAILISSTVMSTATIAGLITWARLAMWWISGAHDACVVAPRLVIADMPFFAALLVLQAVVLFVHARYRAIGPTPLLLDALRAFGVYAAVAIIAIVCMLIPVDRQRASDLVIVFATLVGAAIPASFVSVAIYNWQARRSSRPGIRGFVKR